MGILGGWTFLLSDAPMKRTRLTQGEQLSPPLSWLPLLLVALILLGSERAASSVRPMINKRSERFDSYCYTKEEKTSISPDGLACLNRQGKCCYMTRQ